MRKTKLFVFAVLAVFGCLTASAQTASSFEDLGLQEGQGYTMKTDARSSWTINESNKLQTLKSVAGADAQLDPADANQNFGFVIVDGEQYLYSLGQKMFVNQSGGLDNVPVNPVYLFPYDSNVGGWAEAGADYTHVFFSFDASRGNYNINDNGNDIVINNYNSADAGNLYAVTATSLTFDADQVRASLNVALIVSDCVALAQKLVDAKNNIGTNPTQYNIPDPINELVTSRSLRNIWGAIEEYATTSFYDGQDIETVQGYLDSLQELWALIETTLVKAYELTAGEPLKIEAEFADFFYYTPESKNHVNAGFNASVDTKDNGVALSFDNSARRRFAARYIVNVPEGAEGTYVVTGKHSSMQNRFFGVQVNDEVEHISSSVVASSDWGLLDGDIQEFKVNLKAGENVIVLRGIYAFEAGAEETPNDCNSPAIDYLLLTKADADEEQAENWISKLYVQADQLEGGTLGTDNRDGFYNPSIGFDGEANGSFSVEAPATGAYIVEFTYATYQNRDFALIVNGEDRIVVSVSSNDTWNDASHGRQVMVWLNEGENIVTLDGNNSNSPIIDFFYFKNIQTEGFVIHDDASTGISEVETSVQTTANQKVFNLQGQRVNTVSKGLYIQNGKKFIVK